MNPLQKTHSFTQKRAHTFYGILLEHNQRGSLASGVSISNNLTYIANALNPEFFFIFLKVNKLMDKFEGLAC